MPTLSESSQGWKPPGELRRSCPREVSLSRAGIALQVVCVLLVLGGVAAAILVGAKVARDSSSVRLLREQGVETQAVVTRLWITNGDNRQYRVGYRFAVDGHTHTGSASIRQAAWKKLDKGAQLAVRYVPSQPSTHYLLLAGPHSTPMWVPYAAGIPLTLAGLLLPLGIRRQRRLLADGRPAPGIVIKYRKVYTNHGASQTYMSYEFLLSDGSTRKGRAAVSRRPPEGSLICVLYNPDNPRRSAPYPMRLVKLI